MSSFGDDGNRVTGGIGSCIVFRCKGRLERFLCSRLFRGVTCSVCVYVCVVGYAVELVC